eukprot:SAG11_NODE_303_length_11000_cov_7.979635_5_plen_171_part_00
MVVYIEEAHASDEWPVGALTSVCAQPKSLAERCELARRAAATLFGDVAATAGLEEDEVGAEQEPGRHDVVPVVVDTMENDFQVRAACHLLLRTRCATRAARRAASAAGPGLNSRSCFVSPCVVVQDQMGAWPFRVFVVGADGDLAFKAEPDLDFYGYDLEAVDSWMASEL